MAVWALLGGFAGPLSLAFVSVIARYVNPHEQYLRAVILSAAAFTMFALCIVSSVVLAFRAEAHVLRYGAGWTLGGAVLGGFITGTIFPWGPFGYYLSFLPMGLIIGIIVNGFSGAGLKSAFWAVCGFVTGAILGTVWIMALSSWRSSALNVEPLSAWVPFGLAAYGFTLGLLLSVRRP